MALHKHRNISESKAKEILRDGQIRGRTLSKAQRGFFGAKAGGNTGHQIEAMKRRLKK